MKTTNQRKAKLYENTKGFVLRRFVKDSYFGAIITVFFFLISTISVAQLGSWWPKANFGGTGRTLAVGFSIGSYGYIGTGYAGTPQVDFWRYDPVNNQWTQMVDYPGAARQGAVGFVIGNYGYLGTGNNATNYYQDFYRYDPVNNQWDPISSFTGSGRWQAVAFSVGTKGYVGSGLTGTTTVTNTFYEYDSGTDSWSSITTPPFTARCDMFGFAVSGKGYVGCGRNGTGSSFYSSMYEYDTTGSGTWTTKASFPGSPAAREGVSAFVIGNYGYAGLGSTNNYNTQYTDFYKYDPVGNSWSPIAIFSGTARTNCASFAVGNYGYVGTGFSFGNYTISLYQYDMCGITLTATPLPVSCYNGCDGSATVSPANGTSPYSYLWTPTSQTSQTATGLCAGTYTVLVTDNVGCTKSATATVTQPALLVANITSVGNVSCNGGCNGSITTSITGGTPFYSYIWSSGHTWQPITGLCAGTYTLTVTDSKGCTATVDTVITEPSAIVVTTSSVPNSTGCTCDGIVSVSASGGVPNYTYNWPMIPSCTNDTCTLVCPASYTVVVTDANGCFVMDVVSVNGPFILTLSLTTTPATCPSCPDGDATANPSGGNIPYIYQWTNGQTTQTATGLSPAYYTVCVYDADSCSVCDSVYVGWVIGVDEFTIYDLLTIYPNPTSGKFVVQITNQYRFTDYELEIYNVYGEKVYESVVSRQSSVVSGSGQLSTNNYQRTTNIDLSDSPSGIYFILMQTEQGTANKKLIINK